MVVMETRALSNTKLKTFITAHAQAMFFLLILVKQFSHFWVSGSNAHYIRHVWRDIISYLCGPLSLSHRPNRRAAQFSVLSTPGHTTWLTPQLCWPHPRHHRRTHGGGRQGFSNVGRNLHSKLSSFSACFDFSKFHERFVHLSCSTVDEAENNLKNIKEEEGRSPGILINWTGDVSYLWFVLWATFMLTQATLNPLLFPGWTFYYHV